MPEGEAGPRAIVEEGEKAIDPSRNGTIPDFVEIEDEDCGHHRKGCYGHCARQVDNCVQVNNKWLTLIDMISD